VKGRRGAAKVQTLWRQQQAIASSKAAAVHRFEGLAVEDEIATKMSHEPHLLKLTSLDYIGNANCKHTSVIDAPKCDDYLLRLWH
jgi:hypothetical protein